MVLLLLLLTDCLKKTAATGSLQPRSVETVTQVKAQLPSHLIKWNQVIDKLGALTPTLLSKINCLVHGARELDPR